MTKRKVLFIAIDGCRIDALLLNGGAWIRRMIATGAFSFHSQCIPMTLSGPSWTSIVTGVTPRVHNVRDNHFCEHQLYQGDCRTFLQRLKESNVNLTLSSYVHGWSKMDVLLQPFADKYLYEAEDDEAVVSACENELNSDLCGDVVTCFVDSVDHAGHEYGFGLNSAEYMKAVKGIDDILERLTLAVNARDRDDEEWMVICTTDHGGTSRHDMSTACQHRFDNCVGDQDTHIGVHGLDLPQHRGTFLTVWQPWQHNTVKRGEIVPPPSSIDVTPTICRFMQVDFDIKRKDLCMIDDAGTVANCFS